MDEEKIEGLELVSIEGKNYAHAMVTPELCGVCEGTDTIELKEKVKQMEKQLEIKGKSE